MKYVCEVCGWEYDEEEGYPVFLLRNNKCKIFCVNFKQVTT